jgi:peroxiredoxin
MNRMESSEAASPGFEVEIKSGGRAYDAGESPRAAPTLSPARAAAKAQSRRRTATLLTLAALVLGVIAAWAWLSNPEAMIPSDAVARVNGEFIYERDLNREMDLTRASTDLSKKESKLPSPPVLLEELITRKMRLQAAKAGGTVLTEQEADRAFGEVLSVTGLSREQLDVALARRNLKLDDLKAVAAETALINKYIATVVVAGAKTREEAQNLKNDWEISLAQTARVERYKPAGAGPAPRVNSEAPDFTLKDMNGHEVKLSSLRGKPVMLNFWATWCPPCRAEIPTITEMYKSTHKGEGPYEVLGIATQSDEQTIRAFTQEFGMTFPVLPDGGSQVTSLYHVLPIPTTFFIDKDGIIRQIHSGPVDRALMEKWLLGF